MSSLAVSVIIPFFGQELEGIRHCLESVLDQQGIDFDYEVIVVDNNASPLLAEALPAHRRLTILHEAAPGSYRARNAGLRAAQGDVIAFTDSDCVPGRDWLAQGYARYIQTPACGFVAGGIVLTYLKEGEPNAHEVYDSCVHMRQEAYVRNMNFGATANLFVGRDTMLRLEGFDTSFFSGGDRNLGFRIGQLGLAAVYCPEATIRHGARGDYAAIRGKVTRLVGQELVIAQRAGMRGWRGRLAKVEIARTFPRIAMIWKGRKRFGWGKMLLAMLVLGRVQACRYREVIRLALGGAPRR